MTPHNYFEIYELILNTLAEHNPDNMHQLLDYLSDTSFIKQNITPENKKQFVNLTLETTENLIDDQLVKGSVTRTKCGNIFKLHGLTTLGYSYLQSLNNPTFKDKLITVLKEEGIPVTPTSITRSIAKLLW